MAKLHSASPREITSPFTREIISVLHSKACNNLYSTLTRVISYIYSILHILTIVFPDTRTAEYQPIFHGVT